MIVMLRSGKYKMQTMSTGIMISFCQAQEMDANSGICSSRIQSGL